MISVRELDAGDDRYWFADHPWRRFRARRIANGHWLIRRHGDALLRTFIFSTARLTDIDGEIALLWFVAAWPQLSSPKANSKARQAGIRRVGGRR